MTKCDGVNKRLAANVGLLITAVIWGSTFSITKVALTDVDPMLFLFVRFAAALATLALLSAVRLLSSRNRPEAYRLTLTRALRPGIILGLIFAIGYVTQTEGLRYTTATASGFITGMNVVFVGLMYSILNRRIPARHSLIGIALATVGLLTISVSGRLTIARGDLLTLICAVFFGLHIVVTEVYARHVDPVEVALVQAAVLCLVTLILTQAQGVSMRPYEISARALAAALYCGIFATSVALVIQTLAQRVTSSVDTAIIYSMEPVFSAVFAFAFLREAPTLQTLAGGLLIFAGVVTVNLSEAREPEPRVSC
ncbi:MAG TPA: DMT family transporter [Bacillota bacterium]|nr:DMT family transporter [Bacillota bacterium]